MFASESRSSSKDKALKFASTFPEGLSSSLVMQLKQKTNAERTKALAKYFEHLRDLVENVFIAINFQ